MRVRLTPLVIAVSKRPENSGIPVLIKVLFLRSAPTIPSIPVRTSPKRDREDGRYRFGGRRGFTPTASAVVCLLNDEDWSQGDSQK